MMANRVRARGLRFSSTAVLLGALYLAVVLLLRSSLLARAPAEMALGVTLDLTVTATALVYFLLVRPRLLPAVALVPVFAGGLLAASRLVPAAHQEGVRLLAAGWAVVELLLGALVLARLRRLVRAVRAHRREGERFPGALERGLTEVLGSPSLGSLLARELTAWVYGVGGNFRRAPSPSPQRFAYHRGRHYPAVLGVLLFVLLVETVLVHVVLAPHHLALAWILTASSAYAALWLLGDLHALRLHPYEITERELILDVGLRWRIRVPRADILSVEIADPPASPGLLRAHLLGGADVVLTLSRPTTAVGLLHRRIACSRIALAVDDPAGFIAALASTSI